jgi:hypothetical protein
LALRPLGSLLGMVEVIYLAPGEQPREHAEDEGWLHIDATPDGFFFGSGTGWLPGGERVNYVSRREDDVSLERALEAALDWAGRRGVPRIYVHGLASH